MTNDLPCLPCPMTSDDFSAARKNGKRLVCERMYDEMVELRELVRDMHKAFVHGNCYRWCECEEPCNYISDGRCQWRDRMRNLGIEVNQ